MIKYNEFADMLKIEEVRNKIQFSTLFGKFQAGEVYSIQNQKTTMKTQIHSFLWTKEKLKLQVKVRIYSNKSRGVKLGATICEFIIQIEKAIFHCLENVIATKMKHFCENYTFASRSTFAIETKKLFLLTM